MNNIVSVLLVGGTTDPCRAPRFVLGFDGVHVAHHFSFHLCVVFVSVRCLVCPIFPVSPLDCPFLIAHF
jgi:hypothetical protein